MNNPIEALITQTTAPKLSTLIQLDSKTLREVLRQNYLKAVDAGFIKALITLVSIAGRRDGAGLIYEADFEQRRMQVRLTAKGNLTVSIDDSVICSNHQAGEEMLVIGQGRWLVFIAERLQAVEEADNAKKEKAEAEALANQHKAESLDHQEMVNIFRVDV